MKFKTKSFVVEAFCFNGSNENDLIQFFERNKQLNLQKNYIINQNISILLGTKNTVFLEISITNNEGLLISKQLDRININDYLVMYDNGFFGIMNDQEFEHYYELFVKGILKWNSNY